MKRNIENILSVFAQATPREMREGLDWYASANKHLASVWGETEKTAAIVAALSPGLRWERNVEAARRVIGHTPLDGLGVRWYDGVRKAERIAHRNENPAVVLKGNKVRAFWQCIAWPMNRLHVCIDGHAYAIWRGKYITTNDTPTLTDRTYNVIRNDYCLAADKVGLVPNQLQAVTWVTWRRIQGVTK